MLVETPVQITKPAATGQPLSFEQRRIKAKERGLQEAAKFGTPITAPVVKAERLRGRASTNHDLRIQNEDEMGQIRALTHAIDGINERTLEMWARGDSNDAEEFHREMEKRKEYIDIHDIRAGWVRDNTELIATNERIDREQSAGIFGRQTNTPISPRPAEQVSPRATRKKIIDNSQTQIVSSTPPERISDYIPIVSANQGKVPVETL